MRRDRPASIPVPVLVMRFHSKGKPHARLTLSVLIAGKFQVLLHHSGSEGVIKGLRFTWGDTIVHKEGRVVPLFKRHVLHVSLPVL